MTGEKAPLSAAVVAVRLRRFWLGEAARSGVARKSDLADAWLEVALRRTAEVLTIYTPYDFGLGDPLEGRLGELLRRRVRTLSGGAVREVTWEHDPVAAKPATRRAQTSDLDIYSPGDPDLDEYDEVLGRLRKAIPSDTGDAAREVLGRLGLAGVSRYRMWFVAPDAETERAVRTTSGAAYALHAAVQAVQKSDPLHRVIVDGTSTAARL